MIWILSLVLKLSENRIIDQVEKKMFGNCEGVGEGLMKSETHVEIWK